MDKTKVFSPKQVFFGSFLGGPVTPVYYLRQNFLALNKLEDARLTLLWGVVLNLAILAPLPFLPERFPNYVIPLAYCWLARSIAESRQLNKAAIANSTQFEFASNWRVAGIALVSLVATVAVWFSIWFPLAYFGVIKPE
jgi:hypothetical protein